jgi:hypothetical protein
VFGVIISNYYYYYYLIIFNVYTQTIVYDRQRFIYGVGWLIGAAPYKPVPLPPNWSLAFMVSGAFLAPSRLYAQDDLGA